MRLETGNLPYDGFEQLMETTHEHPIDLEYSLPDYCTDIQKILKCIVTPEVASVAVLGDSLTVDGTADIRVLYLDAKGSCVRGFDTKKEFTWTMRLSGNADGATASVRPFVQHMTCRAMNARRVDVHVTLGFAVSVCAVRRMELTESVAETSVETRCENYDVTRAVGVYSHTFILEENAELQTGRPPIETILRRSVRWQIDSVQTANGQAIVSGRAELEVLYRSFSDEIMPERFLCELPFTETVDCAGVDDACTAEAQITGGECTVQPREDSVGEYMLLNIYLKPCIRLRFSKPCSVRTVCDAFATKGTLEAKYKSAPLERESFLPPRRLQVRENIQVPEKDLERVLDLWCESLTVSSFTEKESASVRGKFTVCMLYQNTEGRVSYTERMLDFTDTRDAEENCKCTATGEITGARFTIADAGTVECTTDITVSERVRVVYTARTLESAELDEDASSDGCCAAVYYAARGESVWDIAKRYSARVSAVKTHNNCTEDILPESRPMIICRK